MLLSRPLLASAVLGLSSSLALSQGISIFTAGTAGEAVTTSDLTHFFDTTVRSSVDHTLSTGTDIQMSAGHHLVIYNSRFDRTSSNNRSEMQTNLNLGGNDLSFGWSQGYIRTDNGQTETITAGGTIIEAAASEVLQLQTFRTDNNGGAGVARIGGNTGIQLLKLDDSWDYLRIQGDGGNQALLGSSGTTTWLPVEYRDPLEVDAASFDFTGSVGTPSADITLKTQGHYMVFANSFLNTGGGQDRESFIQRMTLDGTEVTGSRTSVYVRGNQNGSYRGSASIGMIIETTAANQVLNVEILQDVGRTGNIIGDRTALSIVKLPDTADFVRLEDTNTSQNLNASITLEYDDVVPSSQVELDASFSHDTATNPGQVGVTASGDYLFLAGQFCANDGVQRGFYNQGWQVNGTGGLSAHGQTGRYTRNTGGVDSFGNWSGFLVGLNASDYVEGLVQPLGNSGTNTADTLAMQGVRVDNIFGPDVTPPTIIGLTPADDEPEFFSGDSIVANFSEAITLKNGGTITVKNLDTLSDTLITIPDATQLSLSGGSLTIAPTGGLAVNTNYAIQISADAIEDQATVPNAFAGILDDTTWNFTTLPLDVADPVITTLVPADDATDVAFNLGSLSVTFDEIVSAGTGNITITNVTDNTTFATIDITDGSQATVVNDTLTITVPSLFEVTKEYTVQIDSTAIVDRSSNTFPGIADNTTWSFTIETFPDPVAYWPLRDGGDGVTVAGADDLVDAGLTFQDAIVSGNSNATWTADPFRGLVYSTGEGNRLNGGTQGIDRNVGFTWSFWAKVDASNASDSGADTIIGTRSGSGGSWHKLQLDASSNWTSVNYNSATSYDTWHHFAYVGDSTSVRMYVDGVFVAQDTTTPTSTFNGNMEIGGTSSFSEDITGLMSDVAIWQAALPVDLITQLANDTAVFFPDASAPVLAATTPADDDAAASGNFLQAILDEPVTIGTGDIRIVNTTDSTTTTIAVTDGSQVTVAGASITISPAAALQAGKNYAIEMDAGVVVNLSGLPFGGIADQTIWNFTVETTPPVLVSTDPGDEATGVSPSANLVASFDEPMTKGTGNILVKNLTDATTTTIDVTSTEVSVSGSTVTVNPAALLLPGKSYAVQVEAGALTDVSGNAFAGVLDDTTWNFTTGTPATGLIVYEGFQYADPSTNDPLEGQPNDPGVTDTDATGLLGTWDDVSGTGEMFLFAGSLVFGDHSTTGNRVAFNSNANSDIFARDLTTDAALGVGGNGEIWFSFLSDKLANNFSAAQGGVALTNQALAQEAQIPANNGSDGLIGFAIAPTTSGNNWTAHAWNGSSRLQGDATLPVGVGSNDVRLLVGRIVFDSGTGGADVFTAFEYQLNGGAIAGGSLSQIASPLEVNIDQNVLDTLNVTRRVNTAFDEIRIGTSLADVVPGAGAPPNPYDIWVTANSVTGGPGDDDDLDTLDNLLEFGFGTDPQTGDNLVLLADGTRNGTPISQSSGSGGGVTHDLLFVRRDDHGTSGSVTYTARFSGDLVTFFDSTVTPTFVADSSDDADYEVVSIPYPTLLPNGQKARFAQIVVELVP